MKKLAYFLFPIIVIIVAYTFFRTGSDKEYIQLIEKEREERIRFLRASEASPFRLHDIEFAEPEYFPISSEYKVNGRLERIKNGEHIRINNSDGSTTSYRRFAYAHFTLKGNPYRLLILKPVGTGALNQYFTGFADNTSGNTTYGGGRYLDLEIGKSDKVIIDFNLAYNPYCAYVSEYQCPFPPKENILPIRIEAGEKDYQH